VVRRGVVEEPRQFALGEPHALAVAGVVVFQSHTDTSLSSCGSASRPRTKQAAATTPCIPVSHHGHGANTAPTALTQLVLGMGKDPDASLVDVDPSTIYSWVARARERCYAETGEDGWEFVGPHDLRRSWGVRLLEAGVLPSVVMEWGGWEDWQTFRDHYLAEFSPEALRRERGKVGWLAEGRGEQDVGGSNQGYAAVDPGSARRY